MSSIAKGFNKQSLSNTTVLLPRVDWTRAWTDEEILKDYGYTEYEINQILREENNQSNKTYEDLAMITYAPEYREFYKLNNKVNHYAIKSYERTPKADNIRYDYDSNKAFAIAARTALDGVHKLEGKGSFDVDFNINKIKTIKDTNIWKRMDGSLAQSAVGYIYFNSEIEKNNLCRFWYYNPLMNKLIKGLNQTGGLFTIAIPNINYSIDRDYEHLTLDDIMKILRDENGNQTYEDLECKHLNIEFYKLMGGKETFIKGPYDSII